VSELRTAVLAAVATRIDALPRPALVGVDGVTAAGKTTFAAELVALVSPPAVRISVDDFHRPEAERHARGRGPESYYHDTFDLPGVREALGRVDAQAVAIADGVFLLRPELADLWDLTIFLAVDRAVALDRAIVRDAARMNGVEAARARYASRYVPGETLYLEAVDPETRADIVVDTTDPRRPRLIQTCPVPGT
jgi:uridine kinase